MTIYRQFGANFAQPTMVALMATTLSGAAALLPSAQTFAQSSAVSEGNLANPPVPPAEVPWGDRVSRNLALIPFPVSFVNDETRPDPERTPSFIPVHSIPALAGGLCYVLGDDAQLSDLSGQRLVRSTEESIPEALHIDEARPWGLVVCEHGLAEEFLSSVTIRTTDSLAFSTNMRGLSTMEADSTTVTLRVTPVLNGGIASQKAVWSLPPAPCSILDFARHLLWQDPNLSIHISISSPSSNLDSASTAHVGIALFARAFDPDLSTREEYQGMAARLLLEEDEIAAYHENPEAWMLQAVVDPDEDRQSFVAVRLAGMLGHTVRRRTVEVAALTTEQLAKLVLMESRLVAGYDIARRRAFAEDLDSRLRLDADEIPAGMLGDTAYELARTGYSEGSQALLRRIAQSWEEASSLGEQELCRAVAATGILLKRTGPAGMDHCQQFTASVNGAERGRSSIAGAIQTALDALPQSPP